MVLFGKNKIFIFQSYLIKINDLSWYKDKIYIIQLIKDLFFILSSLRIKSKEIIPGCLYILKTKKFRIKLLNFVFNNNKIFLKERQEIFYKISSIIIEKINPKFNINY